MVHQITAAVNDKLREYDRVSQMFSSYKNVDNLNMQIESKASLDHIAVL